MTNSLQTLELAKSLRLEGQIAADTSLWAVENPLTNPAARLEQKVHAVYINLLPAMSAQYTVLSTAWSSFCACIMCEVLTVTECSVAIYMTLEQTGPCRCRGHHHPATLVVAKI